MIAALLVSASAWAQTTVATMTTTGSEVSLGVAWSGTGEIRANGVLMNNNSTITPVTKKIEN